MKKKKNKKTRRKKTYIPKISNQSKINSGAKAQSLNDQENNTKKSILSKYWLFDYPEESSVKRAIFSTINSISVWTLFIFLISNRLFNVPDLDKIPQPILTISGTGMMFSIFTQIFLIAFLFYHLKKGRVVLVASSRKFLATRYATARTISFSSLILLFIYSSGAANIVTFFMGKLAALSESIINNIVTIGSTVFSIITGVVSNIIYNFIRVQRRKYKIRRKKAILSIIFCCLLLGCGQTQHALSPETSQIVTSESAININTASVEELEKLPHIGEKLAAKIVDHREKFGKFRKPEHLMLVRGISDERFRAMRNSIKVED